MPILTFRGKKSGNNNRISIEYSYKYELERVSRKCSFFSNVYSSSGLGYFLLSVLDIKFIIKSIRRKLLKDTYDKESIKETLERMTELEKYLQNFQQQLTEYDEQLVGRIFKK